MKDKAAQQTTETTTPVTNEPITNTQETQQTQEPTTQETSYIVGNRAFNTYEDAQQYYNESDFDHEIMIEKTKAVSPSQDNKEVFYILQ